MKKLTLTAIIALTSLPFLNAQDIPINGLGAQLDFGVNRSHYEDYTGDTLEREGTTNTISVNPKVRFGLTENINAAIGLRYMTHNYTQQESNSNGSTITDNETLMGPSLSFTRYCDPCESEEDCDRYFTFLGLNVDMLAGKREYEYKIGSFSDREIGKVRQTNLGFTGGVAYRVLPGLYLQGSVNVLGLSRQKTIYDNDRPNQFRTNNNISFFSGGSAGAILPF